MKTKKVARPAVEGQLAVEVGCNCEGTTLVIDRELAGWSCGRCRCKAKPTGRTVVLGVDGALPVGWRDVEFVEAVAS